MELSENTALVIGLAPVLMVGIAYVVHIYRKGRLVQQSKEKDKNEGAA
jgi:cbb3-type cytochrome oxidase subunit 3